LLSPAIVQGEQGAESVLLALHRLLARPEIELIIIARGGGSMEDLWCFNNESLARAVFACPVPVISAIGHETDFTILDFVADVRAATPTAAAQLATPDTAELAGFLLQMQVSIRTNIQYNLYNQMQWLDDISEKMGMQRHYLLQQKNSELQILQANLQQFNPRTFLDKGYSLVLKNGHVVKSVAEVTAGDELEIVLKDGRINVVVN
jgi:exodeoxyribonuclease VII large subunit